MYDEQFASFYEAELEREYRRVMVNDVAAKHGYDTAKIYQLDEIGRLKAAVVALSNSKRNLSQRVKARK